MNKTMTDSFQKWVEFWLSTGNNNTDSDKKIGQTYVIMDCVAGTNLDKTSPRAYAVDV